MRSSSAPPKPVHRTRPKIAVITIATGRYFDAFFADLQHSIRQNFSRGALVELFCFTDQKRTDHDDTHYLRAPASEWPFSTLLRFHLFDSIKERLRLFDHVVYMDADMIVRGNVDVADWNSDFFAVQHPNFERHPLRATYEIDRGAAAFVRPSKRGAYVQGCFFGGKALPFIYLSQKLSTKISEDLATGDIPVWHDESYLNWFFSSHPFKLLPPVYACPEGSGHEARAIIIHRIKDHGEVRRTDVLGGITVSRFLEGSPSGNHEAYRQLYLRSHEKVQRLEGRFARRSYGPSAIVAIGRYLLRRVTSLFRHRA